MLQRLIHWIGSNVTTSSARNALGLPGFRAHLERLENRLALSATFGTSAAEGVAAGTGAWDSPAIFADRPEHAPVSLGGTAHWEDSLATGVLSRHVEWGRVDRGPLMARADGSNVLLLNQSPARLFVITFYVPAHGVSAKALAPIGMPQVSIPSPFPKPPIGATSPYGPSQVNPSPEYPPTPQPGVTPIERPGTLLTASLVRSDNLAISQHRHAQGQDVVTRSRSAESLLLAANVHGSTDFNIDNVFDDWRTGSDRDEIGLIELDELSLDDSTSLNAVWRERQAVDAVFGNLHELSTRDAERKSSESEEQSTANENGHYERISQYPPTEAAQTAYAPHDVADGGMVLLAPVGDANHSVGDLIGDVVRIVESANHVPIGIEASIGIYQAIDVGAVESPQANGVSAAGTRAADGRPHLTNENSAEKRIEQPS